MDRDGLGGRLDVKEQAMHKAIHPQRKAMTKGSSTKPTDKENRTMMSPNRTKMILTLAALVMAALVLPAAALEIPAQLPRPDGKPADMSKPVQVYILMGQSNAVGLGKIASLEAAVKEKKKYLYLVDEAGNWIERKDVRNVFIMSLNLQHNDWMSVNNRKNLGVEYAVGHCLGYVTDAPVMILKSCIGNRSLGWDLLPPGSEPWEFEGKIIPGYRGTPSNPKGTGEKVTGEWYAGKQYDDDVEGAKKVLSELDKYYPGAKNYEVAGFFFWQGEKDCGSASDAERYEFNLVRFIKQLRKDFNAPNAKFVLATLGEAKKGEGGNKGKVTDAQLAVDGNNGKYPEFKGNVACVYSNPFCHGGSGNSHYGGNAETYMDVGEAMGRAMAAMVGSTNGSDTPDAGPLPEGLDETTISSSLRPALDALSHRNYWAVMPLLDRLEKTYQQQQSNPNADQAALQAELKAIQTIRAFVDEQVTGAFERIKSYVSAGNLYRANQLVVEYNRYFRGIEKYETPVADLQKAFLQDPYKTAIQQGTQFYQLLANAQRVRTPRTIDLLAKFAESVGDTAYGKAANAAVAALNKDPQVELDGDTLVAGEP
jgi:hypothetical protein